MLSGCPAQADFCADQVTQWARTLANHLPAKYTVKKETKTCRGQAKFEMYLSQGQAFFFFQALTSKNERDYNFYICFCFIVTKRLIVLTVD